MDDVSLTNTWIQPISNTLKLGDVASNGANLLYPAQQILFHNQTKDTDGSCRQENWLANANS